MISNSYQKAQLMPESSTEWESKEGLQPRAPMTRSLCYATRKNSRTPQTANRKAQVFLKWKYTLKSAGSSERLRGRVCPQLWMKVFVFLEVGSIPRLSSLPPSPGLFAMPPEGRRLLKAIYLIAKPWLVSCPGVSCFSWVKIKEEIP